MFRFFLFFVSKLVWDRLCLKALIDPFWVEFGNPVLVFSIFVFSVFVEIGVEATMSI